jgi:hypothetical protein
VDTSNVLGELAPDPGRDQRPDVPARGAKLLVTQDLGHQPVPELRDGSGLASLGRREWKTRVRRHHDIEGVRRVSAMGDGIGQQRQERCELEEAAWPAVCEDQRERIRPPAASVNEMNDVAAYRDLELLVLV